MFGAVGNLKSNERRWWNRKYQKEIEKRIYRGDASPFFKKYIYIYIYLFILFLYF